MMIKKKNWIISAIISVSAAIILAGCAKQSEPAAAVQTNNINQSPTASANNTVSANSSNAPATTGNNSPAPNATNKQSSPPVKMPTPQIGSGAEDMLLFTQARGALSSDAEFVNGVIVDVKEGNAILTGSVSSEAQKTKAGQLVQNIKGIKSVKNNLRVAS